ncbi:MAG TPA: DUF423 domain-containing protein [Candidatus Acidoferrum sp.]|nr:DUF423 domain-containing protein [Candidatus Acidoferrum sp.]
MPSLLPTRLSALMGLLAVALGGFGAHSMKAILAQNGTTSIWEKAAFYHFIHAVMLFILAERKPFHCGPWWCFLIGIFFFSGSLYLLAATNILWLGAITPIGGVSFLIGWGWLLFKPSRQ